MPWFYYVGTLLVRVLLFLFTNWQVRGRENIPRQGGLLVVANHISLADPPVLGVSLGRKAAFVAKKELFHFRLIGYFIRGFGAFPVHRGRLDRKALRQAQQVLAQGLALIVFPEGRRSKKAQLKSAFSGTALIALRNGVPILPVGITGTEKIRGVAWLLARPQVIINIGRPFYLPPIGSRLTKVELTELTNSIMERIAELLPLEHRGIYAEQRN